MSDMIRKQIYLQKRHQLFLKKMAHLRGVSEAEIIRQALDREESFSGQAQIPTDRLAWEEILRFVESRKAGAISGNPYKWNRDDAYDERSTH